MTKKIVDFYDKESTGYTQKRYPVITESYTQYIFKKRLAVFLSFIESVIDDLPQDISMLEIGCADGIILKAVEERFPNRFSKLVGVDISPGMIKEAKDSNKNPRASYFLRDELISEKFTLVVELGVHPFDLAGELSFVNSHLQSGGYFFYDLVGLKALYTRIKLKGEYFVSDYKTYKNSDTELSSVFTIVKASVYGFFVPKIWSRPSFARVIQPIVDAIFQNISPELFQEKIYLLKKKD